LLPVHACTQKCLGTFGAGGFPCRFPFAHTDVRLIEPSSSTRKQNQKTRICKKGRAGRAGRALICLFLLLALCGSVRLSVALCGSLWLLYTSVCLSAFGFCGLQLLASVAFSSWLPWILGLCVFWLLLLLLLPASMVLCFFCGSLPDRWGSLDFNKGATHSHPLLLLPSSSHLLLCQFAEPHISSSGQYCPLDPNLILRGPDAVGWAWARTERMAA
jgi:hypothetical protein